MLIILIIIGLIISLGWNLYNSIWCNKQSNLIGRLIELQDKILDSEPAPDNINNSATLVNFTTGETRDQQDILNQLSTNESNSLWEEDNLEAEDRELI